MYEPERQSRKHQRASSFLGSTDVSLSSSCPGFFWGHVISSSHTSRLAQIRNTHRLFLGFAQSFSPWDHVFISLPHPQKLLRKKNWSGTRIAHGNKHSSCWSTAQEDTAVTPQACAGDSAHLQVGVETRNSNG